MFMVAHRGRRSASDVLTPSGQDLDRSPPTMIWKLYKVVCIFFFHTSAASLLLCLEIWVPHFAILSFFFPLPHSPSCCLVVILALAICFTVRHRRRWREAGRETELKRAELKSANNNDACSFYRWCSGVWGLVPDWFAIKYGHLKGVLWCFWKHDHIFSPAKSYMKRRKRLDVIRKLQTVRHWMSKRKLSNHARNDKLRIVERMKHGPNQHSRLASLSNCNFIDFNNSKVAYQRLCLHLSFTFIYSENFAHVLGQYSKQHATQQWCKPSIRMKEPSLHPASLHWMFRHH